MSPQSNHQQELHDGRYDVSRDCDNNDDVCMDPDNDDDTTSSYSQQVQHLPLHILHQQQDQQQYSSTMTSSVKPLSHVGALVFGQLVAMVATSQNAASFTLEYGFEGVFPFALMLPTFICLSLHLIYSQRTQQTQEEQQQRQTQTQQQDHHNHHHPPYRFLGGMLRLRTPWYWYLWLSVLDLGPNYLTLLALNYTTLTSATLLGSLTIPSTMVFCFLILKKRYTFFHYVGVAFVMVGGTLTILEDRSSNNNDTNYSNNDNTSGDSAIGDLGNMSTNDDPNYDDRHHPYMYIGDVLAVLAALGYGVGDAAAEYWSKHIDRKEYLGMLGLFGTMWTTILFLLLEWDDVITFFTELPMDQLWRVILVILWYIVSLVAYYIMESLFLKGSDATLLNLSLQSSQFYAILFSVLAFQEYPPQQFYVALTCVVIGVFIYELCGNAGRTLSNLRRRRTTAPHINVVETEGLTLDFSSSASNPSPERSPILQGQDRSRSSSPTTNHSMDYDSIETTALVHHPSLSV